MRVSICVGEYAKMPYCIPGLEMDVYCMEELCCCMRDNAFLLDISLLNDGLLNWIAKECGLKELAGALHPLVHKQGSLSAFVVMIQRYVGFYDEEAIREIEEVVRQGSGLSGIERRKGQIDYLVRKKKFKSALRGYDELLWMWQGKEGKPVSEKELLTKKEFLSDIWHNKGVAYAGLMRYDKAADCFERAYGLDGQEEHAISCLAAKRLQLAEKDYVAFVAEHREWHPFTLGLEKKLKRAGQEWEQQPDYLRLWNRRELRTGGDRRRYYEDNERLAQALKDSYRRE